MAAGLVDEHLGTGRIEDSVSKELRVGVVDAHAPVLRVLDARLRGLVASGLRDLDVAVGARGLAHLAQLLAGLRRELARVVTGAVCGAVGGRALRRKRDGSEGDDGGKRG